MGKAALKYQFAIKRLPNQPEDLELLQENISLGSKCSDLEERKEMLQKELEDKVKKNRELTSYVEEKSRIWNSMQEKEKEEWKHMLQGYIAEEKMQLFFEEDWKSTENRTKSLKKTLDMAERIMAGEIRQAEKFMNEVDEIISDPQK